ncbi:MAG: glycerophosphodiester phosphodiesterase family protein [Chlorobi bacterium]|nr:glycerophosphodiester phosphodiesterase family protein [Chlorobiota bacterium]
MMPLAEFVRTRRRFVVAHRGASAVAPENTLAAITSAIAVGVPMVEIDVQLTRDGHAVLFHDRTIGRTTSGRGRTHRLTYTELARLDAGEWFDESFRGERVPLLAEALRLLARHQTYASIEIKPATSRDDIRWRVERIAVVVAECEMVEHVLFTSFDHTSLQILREILPACHTAAINIPGDRRLPSEITRPIGCEAFVCSLAECTRWRITDAVASGLYVGVYTVNTPRQLQRVLRYPVTAIVSNHPASILQLLGTSEGIV